MNCCGKHGDHKEKQEERLEHQETGIKKAFPWWWCLLLVPVALGAIYIFRIPVNSLLPWGVFLLCPLMHVFMMKGHDGHEGHEKHKEEKE